MKEWKKRVEARLDEQAGELRELERKQRETEADAERRRKKHF